MMHEKYFDLLIIDDPVHDPIASNQYFPSVW